MSASSSYDNNRNLILEGLKHGCSPTELTFWKAWINGSGEGMEISRSTISCSFSKSCLTNVNYLQLLAVGKGQGLLGFSICTINWFAHRNGAAPTGVSCCIIFSDVPQLSTCATVFILQCVLRNTLENKNVQGITPLWEEEGPAGGSASCFCLYFFYNRKITTISLHK